MIPEAFSGTLDYHRTVEGSNASTSTRSPMTELSVEARELPDRIGGLFEATTLALAIVDPTGEVLAVNAAFRGLLGDPPNGFVGQDLATLLGVPEDFLEPVVGVATGARAQYRFETRVFGQGAERFWGALTLATLAGEEPSALVLLENVTDRRRIEEEQLGLRLALGKAASEWRATFDAIDIPIFILDEDSRITRLNRAARDLVGAPFRNILGHRLDDLGPGEPWSSAATLAARVQRDRRPGEEELRGSAEESSWALAASLSFPDLSTSRSLILTVSDHSGMVRLQESLRRSETMAAMGSLVAGVAHEVRNPLFGISAVVDALQRKVEERDGLGRHLGFLRRELDRLEALMRDLLEFGRPVRLDASPDDLDRVVDEAVRGSAALFERAGVEVERSSAVGGLGVRVDRPRAVQAVLNVLENAAHHSAPGHRVRVRTGCDEGWCEVVVHDAGRGFDPAELARVFEPFYSRRPGGTGLGLPIVARIVDLHGGEVEVGNHPDGGGLVALRFPAFDPVAGGPALDAEATHDFHSVTRHGPQEVP